MIIKKEGYSNSVLTQFDLIKNNHYEVALTKSFAYILGKNPNALFRFLRFIGISINNTKNNFKEISIDIESNRAEGRTDIEIKLNKKFHVIIEAKVRGNKVLEGQRTQYIDAFDQECLQNVQCIISHHRDSNIFRNHGVEIKIFSWLDVINLFDDNEFTNNKLMQDYMRFAMKKFRLKEMKEVLIQDLKQEIEVERFIDNKVYRRNATNGTPIYFAPYFAENARLEIKKGISKLSRIMGVLTINPTTIDQFQDDLKEFFREKEKDEEEDTYNTIRNLRVKEWIIGVKLIGERERTLNQDELLTYYFLDEPIFIDPPLQKDTGGGMGIGKDWIARMIPPNRCVSFKEFTRRMQLNRVNTTPS